MKLNIDDNNSLKKNYRLFYLSEKEQDILMYSFLKSNKIDINENLFINYNKRNKLSTKKRENVRNLTTSEISSLKKLMVANFGEKHLQLKYLLKKIKNKIGEIEKNFNEFSKKFEKKRKKKNIPEENTKKKKIKKNNEEIIDNEKDENKIKKENKDVKNLDKKKIENDDDSVEEVEEDNTNNNYLEKFVKKFKNLDEDLKIKLLEIIKNVDINAVLFKNIQNFKIKDIIKYLNLGEWLHFNL
jgi:dynein heavy chain, axonemal